MEGIMVATCTPSLSSIRLSIPTTAVSATNHRHLAAFQSPAHLFSNSLSYRIHSINKKQNPNKTHIFLPHLVASMEAEESYIMIKPDGVQRGLVGEIITRFEKKGFKLKGLKLFECPKELAEEHYKDLSSKPFFPKLISYITSGPVVCMAWEGVGVVASARKLIGATNPLQAEPGTIRGDLAVQTGRNVVHGSDSPENGKREIGKDQCFMCFAVTSHKTKLLVCMGGDRGGVVWYKRMPQKNPEFYVSSKGQMVGHLPPFSEGQMLYGSKKAN